MARRVLHDRNSEARNNFTEVFDRTTSGTKWMGAVWVVNEQGKVELTQHTTFQFPTGLFEEALGQLAMALAEEKARLQAGPMLPDEPLPDAPVLSKANHVTHCPACKFDHSGDSTSPDSFPPLPEAMEVTGLGLPEPLGTDLRTAEERAEEKDQAERESSLKSFPEL